MDFGALPPEINSARMYSGPGSGSMLTAAAAWNELAIELHSAAADYGSVISELTAGPWIGAASTSMAFAAARYAAWMRSTAAQTEQAGNQAQAAAAAFEAAFAQTIPPPVIAANRSLLMSLIATNVLGQNGPAIAATEAHYGEMWAQDAAAMYAYTGASAAATMLTPFAPPQPTTNPTGSAAQGAVVAHATGTSIATDTQMTLSQLTSMIPTALQHLVTPVSSTSSSTLLSSLSSTMSTSSAAVFSTSSALQIAKTFGPSVSTVGREVAAPGLAVPGVVGSGAGAFWSTGSASLGAGGTGTVSAGLGRAAAAGALSVPQNWATTPTPGPGAAVGLAGTAMGAAPEVVGDGQPGLLGGLPLAGAAGRGATAAVVPDARFLERPFMLPPWSTVI